MKTLTIVALAFGLAVTTGGNTHASRVDRDQPLPPQTVIEHDAVLVAGAAWRHRRPYDWCEARTLRLRQFEGRARQDGRVSLDEMRIASSLSADLAANCSGSRRVPRRVWYYG